MFTSHTTTFAVSEGEPERILVQDKLCILANFIQRLDIERFHTLEPIR